MYYNIKIKCDGCEFSLDSGNRLIIESEMDKYFATMFGASEKFKANIKNIEIINDDVKSIEEFQRLDIDNVPSKNTDFDTDNSVDNAEQPEPCCVYENLSDETDEKFACAPLVEAVVETPVCSVDIALPSSVVEENEEILINTPSQKQENIDTPLICSDSVVSGCSEVSSQEPFEKIILDEVNDELGADETQEKIEQVDDDIENLISAVEKEIKAVDILDSTNYDSVLSENVKENKKNDFFVEEELVFDENNKIEVEPVRKDEIEQLSNENVVSESFIKKDEIETKPSVDETGDFVNSQKTEENIDTIVSESDIKESKPLEEFQIQPEEVKVVNRDEYLADDENQPIELSEEDKIKKEEIENINQEKLNDIFSQDINKGQEPKKDLITNLLEEINANPIPSYEEYLEQLNKKLDNYHNQVNKENDIPNFENKQPPDFKMYLASFKCSELIDEFLICSYYIKNILNENCFSMKSINSNLYKATGMIADMSVVNELIELGYIKTVYVEDMKKYTITQDGEAYFASRFKN